ncbi:hypothetical protein G6O67_006058 [Ophiocordyceps sinensis]|nr:hypothetical protein G6O67_006058 [Ophiocordyceps sinensis]
MSDQELGLDTVTTGKNDRLFVTIPVEVRGKMRNRELELDPDPIAFQRAIVCRGTSCFLAKPKSPSRHDWVAKLPWTSSMRPAGYNWVVKFSWTSGMRPAEADLLRKANNRGVKGLAKMVGYHEVVTSISKLRQGLVFPNPHKFRRAQMSSQSHFSPSEFGGLGMTNSRLAKRKSTDGGSLVSKRCRLSGQSAQAEHGPYSAQEPENSVQEPESTSLIQYRPYENRIFRVLAVSPAGRSISQFRSIVELLEGLRDAIKAHRSLFMDGRILHRDISENNIIITDPDIADGFKGMLIDLDLAKEDGMPGGGARHRTGTMEFRPSRSYGQYPSSIPYA